MRRDYPYLPPGHREQDHPTPVRTLGQGAELPMEPGREVIRDGKRFIVSKDGTTLMPLLPEHQITVRAPMPPDTMRYLLIAAAVGYLVMKQTGSNLYGAAAAAAVLMLAPGTPFAAIVAGLIPRGWARPGSGASRSF